MRSRIAAILFVSLAAPGVSVALDLAALWDFSDPAASERRFRDALATARGDEALILQTQIARTHGLRRDFGRAREVLVAIEAPVSQAGAEARVRFWLERGRTYASAAHAPEASTAENRQRARIDFEAALALARREGLDALAIDAVHMLAFVDPAPADQLRWAREALDLVLSSSQPDARRWEASVRHNVGYALHRLGRHEEALDEFRRAVALREQGANPAATRVAHWMVARTLRAMGRDEEALAIQSRLEREADAAGQPDPHVFEELEALHRARGDAGRAEHYAGRRKALPR